MWMFEFQLEYSSFHLNIRVSTWIFGLPLEYLSFHLNIRVYTWYSSFHWIFEFPLEYSSFHLNIRVRTYTCLTIFGHTGLRIGPSKAKNCQQSRGVVRFLQNPQNPEENDVQRISNTEKFPKKIPKFFCRHRKIKCWESFEMSFDQV